MLTKTAAEVTTEVIGGKALDVEAVEAGSGGRPPAGEAHLSSTPASFLHIY